MPDREREAVLAHLLRYGRENPAEAADTLFPPDLAA